MRCRLSYLSIVCYLTVLSQPSPVWAGSAVSVPLEARDTAATAVAAAQDVLDKQQEEQARAEAVMYAQKAETEAAEVVRQVVQAEEILARAKLAAEETAADSQQALAVAQEAAVRAAQVTQAANRANDKAKAAVANAQAIEASLQAEEEAIVARRRIPQPVVAQPTALPDSKLVNLLEKTDELLRMEGEIKQLEKQQRDGDRARQSGIRDDYVPEEQAEEEVDWSAAEAAYARAEQLEQAANAANEAAEAAEAFADRQMVAAEAAETKEAEAKQALFDAQLVEKEIKDYALQARQYAVQTKNELAQLIYMQDHPKGAHVFSSELHYYSGNGVYQLTEPMSYGYWHRDVSYSLSTQYIISKSSRAGAEGRVATLGDTILSLAKRQETAKVMLEYSLDVNIPTGKPTLSRSERNTRMNEDLLEVSQFGKGWGFTPAIEASWKIGREDIWTVGTSYAFAGTYDPTADIKNDDISPGNEWRKLLRWQHAGQDWQFIGELSNTSTGVTKIANGENYLTADQWEYKLTYNKKLPKQQSLMLYYWREQQNMNGILPFDTGNAPAHYLGAMWNKKLNDKHTLRVGFDIMRSNGQRYDRISNDVDIDGNPQYAAVNVNGRTKYSLSLGYDVQIDQKRNFSLELQKFLMRDGISNLSDPAATYHGYNIFLKYNKTL